MFVPEHRVPMGVFLVGLSATLLLLALSGIARAAAPIAAAGDVVFVGYNADNADALAIVLLGDAAAGQEIHFRDDEWNGTGWNDANEGELTWTAPVSGAVAGTVVIITDTNGLPAATPGTAVGSLNFNTSNEVVYAYLGTVEVPSVFLAAVASDGYSATNGELSGTGLVAGSTALDVGTIDRDADVAVYDGSRSNQTSSAAYRAQIHDLASYWISDDGTGDQSRDGTAPDLPFDTTPFRTPTALSLQSFEVAMGGNMANLVVSLAGLLLTIGAFGFRILRLGGLRSP